MNGTWAKSSYSCGENNCVETRIEKTPTARKVQVRDTKDHERGVITFGSQAWQAFTRL